MSKIIKKRKLLGVQKHKKITLNELLRQKINTHEERSDISFVSYIKSGEIFLKYFFIAGNEI